MPQVLAEANNSGVTRFIVPGVSSNDWQRVESISDKGSGIFPAFGLHPMHASEYSPSLMESLRLLLPKSVAIGEIGLDYLLKDVPRDIQIEAFRGQLRLAVHEGIPVLIHCRRAFRDLLDILREEKVHKVGGVMHAFSGSPEIALEAIKLGLFISVAGPVTYQNAIKPCKVVEHIPLTHLLLETDAPDLSPEPSFLKFIASKCAEIKQIEFEALAEITTLNAIRLFGL